MFRRNWFHYYLRVCTELQVLSKTVSPLWFYAYKKYKNGNSARRTYLQLPIRPSITQNGSDNFSSGISGNLQKIATSNIIFSRTADRIAVKFCMTIRKIKPNDIFQNFVHSTSTLRSWLYLPFIKSTIDKILMFRSDHALLECLNIEKNLSPKNLVRLVKIIELKPKWPMHQKLFH